MSLREMCSATGLSMTVVFRIVKKDLCMKRRCAKFVPRILTETQKENRVATAQENLDLLCEQDDPEQFMQRIVTGDESWISTFELESKQSSKVWSCKDAKRPKKALPNRSQPKDNGHSFL